jgi:hypothetical protein
MVASTSETEVSVCIGDRGGQTCLQFRRLIAGIATADSIHQVDKGPSGRSSIIWPRQRPISHSSSSFIAHRSTRSFGRLRHPSIMYRKTWTDTESMTICDDDVAHFSIALAVGSTDMRSAFPVQQNVQEICMRRARSRLWDCPLAADYLSANLDRPALVFGGGGGGRRAAPSRRFPIDGEPNGGAEFFLGLREF